MNEAHFAEIEKALLYLTEARKRAERAARTIERDGAEEHLVEALVELERGLAELHRQTMQSTYFAVPAEDGRGALFGTDGDDSLLAGARGDGKSS